MQDVYLTYVILAQLIRLSDTDIKLSVLQSSIDTAHLIGWSLGTYVLAALSAFSMAPMISSFPSLSSLSAKTPVLMFSQLGKDDIMQTGPENPNPALITSHRSLIQQYIRLSHRVCDEIFLALEKQLGLQRGALMDLHDLSAHSGDHVRFLKCPSQSKEDRQTAVRCYISYSPLPLFPLPLFLLQFSCRSLTKTKTMLTLFDIGR